ncbi:MAG: ATP-binding protein [Hyphomicrobiaceae bacterium]
MDHNGFPREPLLEQLGAVITREVTDTLTKAVEVHSLVCFHGEGGCGKTTTAQSLEAALPPGSRTVLYDCYGAGSYRDQSQSCHQPYEAFMQLSNELARVTNTPLFFPFVNRSDMASAFRKKLVAAAELFALDQPKALLVILIDAADNAVHAATRVTPSQECFVHQLVTFNKLPLNVRIVISSRTGRVKDLKLPEDTVSVTCPPFSLKETAAFLALNGLTGPDSSVEDFYELSTHNPRVQSNTVETAESLEDAINFLQPNGQSLPDLFDAMIEKARSRAGVETSRTRLTAALSVMPTPVPIAYLASVCGHEEAVCRDLIVELTQRNVRLSDRGVELANEDFEAYCEEKGQPETAAVTSKTADLLMRDRLTSEYAATHLFELLVQAKRKADLQTCLDEPEATTAIADRVKRRQVELSRTQMLDYRTSTPQLSAHSWPARPTSVPLT